MSARILNGSAVAARLLGQVLRGTADFVECNHLRPYRVTVLVGDDPAPHTYLKMKRNRSAKVGMEPRSVELPTDTAAARA